MHQADTTRGTGSARSREPTLDKLRAAVVAPDVLRERIQTPTLVEEPPDAVHGLADVVPLDQARLCISENSLAELVYRTRRPAAALHP